MHGLNLNCAIYLKLLIKYNLCCVRSNMELLKTVDDIISEMECVYALAETSRSFQMFNSKLTSINMAVYALVVLLNMNVVFSPRRMIVPWNSLMNLINESASIDVYEVLKVILTYVLGGLVLSGYLALSIHQSKLAVPILINNVDAAMRARDNAITKTSEVESKDMDAFQPAVLCAAASFILCFIHVINFAINPYLYLSLICIHFLVTTRCYRNYILIPTDPFERKLCITYDILFTRSFLRNQIVLAACALIGFKFPEFFSLMLLDIVNISPVIMDVIRSIMSSGSSLGWVMYMFIVTNVVIYASWGFVYFSDQILIPHLKVDGLNSTDSNAVPVVTTEKVECNTIYDCFVYIFYQSLSEGGSAKAIFQLNIPGLQTYLPRIAFDSFFFIWVGIVLMNVITGLMVDTFSATREEKADRENTWTNECFICGLGRDDYESHGLPVSFETHTTKDHDLWMYVYYLAYLKRKDPTKFNGIESFVKDQIDKEALDWLPFLSCFAIQDKKGGAEVDASNAETATLHDGSANESSSVTLAKLNSKVEDLALALEEVRALLLERNQVMT